MITIKNLTISYNYLYVECRLHPSCPEPEEVGNVKLFTLGRFKKNINKVIIMIYNYLLIIVHYRFIERFNDSHLGHHTNPFRKT